MMMMMMVLIVMMITMTMAIGMMLAHSWRLPRGGEREQRDNCSLVDSDLLRRYSELGQTLLTYGKLSNQIPSVKSRLMAQTTALPSNCCGNRVD